MVLLHRRKRQEALEALRREEEALIERRRQVGHSIEEHGDIVHAIALLHGNDKAHVATCCRSSCLMRTAIGACACAWRRSVRQQRQLPWL